MGTSLNLVTVLKITAVLAYLGFPLGKVSVPLLTPDTLFGGHPHVENEQLLAEEHVPAISLS